MIRQGVPAMSSTNAETADYPAVWRAHVVQNPDAEAELRALHALPFAERRAREDALVAEGRWTRFESGGVGVFYVPGVLSFEPVETEEQAP
jgi:hypothetical protein